MKIFNTLTRQKDEFVPITKGEVKIYACGPTVYNYIHIGNARPLCVFDTLRRYLEWRGNKVDFVQNFTDIDDKLIKRANEENTTVPDVAERYIKEFAEAGADIITVHQEATRHLDRTVNMIRDLGLKVGVALNPVTPVNQITNILPLLDMVLLMSVNPGFGGQAFIENTINKVKRLRGLIAGSGSRALIEVDGGVQADTAPRLVAAGVDVLVSGSYIFKAADPEAKIRELKRL